MKNMLMLAAVAIITAAPAVLALTPLANAGSKKDLDEKNGFRDLVFAVEISSVSGMKQTDVEGDHSVYVRDSDDLSLGGTNLTAIWYGAYKGLLHTVVLEAKDNDCNVILKAFTASYGRPSQPNRFMETYFWGGKVVTAIYELNEVAYSCSIRMSSRAISKQQMDDEAVAAEKAKKDLLK